MRPSMSIIGGQATQHRLDMIEPPTVYHYEPTLLHQRLSRSVSRHLAHSDRLWDSMLVSAFMVMAHLPGRRSSRPSRALLGRTARGLSFIAPLGGVSMAPLWERLDSRVLSTVDRRYDTAIWSTSLFVPLWEGLVGSIRASTGNRLQSAAMEKP